MPYTFRSKIQNNSWNDEMEWWLQSLMLLFQGKSYRFDFCVQVFSSGVYVCPGICQVWGCLLWRGFIKLKGSWFRGVYLSRHTSGLKVYHSCLLWQGFIKLKLKFHRTLSRFVYWGRWWINSQSLEDTQVGYISQEYTLYKYTLEKYT